MINIAAKLPAKVKLENKLASFGKTIPSEPPLLLMKNVKKNQIKH